MGLVKTLNAVEHMFKLYPNTQIAYVEDKANGPAVINALQSRFPLVPDNPGGDKTACGYAASPKIEAGFFHLPADSNWIEIALSELCGFPDAEHDDVYDVITKFILRAARGRARQIEVA